MHTPIRVGDQFISGNNEVWTVAEDRKFGRGYWVINATKTRQTVMNKTTLQSMQRALALAEGKE